MRASRSKERKPLDNKLQAILDHPLKFLQSITDRGSIGRQLVNDVLMQ